jgi:NAD+ synthase (glutamine-hydrolysing)
MKIAMAQINPTVGDLDGNIKKVRDYIGLAKESKADLVVFPELTVTGYPPQDLLLEKVFVRRNKELLMELIHDYGDLSCVVGFVDWKGETLYNAAAVFARKKLLAVVHKTLLPTYDVFDEDRYFKPEEPMRLKPVTVSSNRKKVNVGVEICEDLWDERYDVDVTGILAKRRADIIVNISASPFYVGKRSEREKLLRKKSKENKIPIFYVNLVGGQDGIVFDGQSMAVDRTGNLIALGKQFQEDLVLTDINLDARTTGRIVPPSSREEQEMLGAIVLGVRDYFKKTGFQKAVIGMSGGIDSSLTTCLAVEALGKENVIGVSMPSIFSSEHSKTAASELAKNLEILYVQFPIQQIVDVYHESMEAPLAEIKKHFGIERQNDDPVADENIQPRVRGNCLMDISNRLRDLKILVLNTGNKSELALGYCTLYGDMAGGIGILGDVSKLEVYKLARYVNEKAGREIVPNEVFVRKPSPELKENQFDPFDFDVVSPLVDRIIEKRVGKQELIEMGYPQKVVEDIYARIRGAEYKRRQAPPCIKVTRQAFGIGWRMPIVNKFEG